MQAFKLQSSTIDNTPYLDLDILEPLANIMSEEQLMFLVTSFYDTLDRTTPEMSKENQTPEKIVSIAHELKGMASNMGLAKLSTFMARFEIQTTDVLFTAADRTELNEIIQDSQNELNLFLRKRGM